MRATAARPWRVARSRHPALDGLPAGPGTTPTGRLIAWAASAVRRAPDERPASTRIVLVAIAASRCLARLFERPVTTAVGGSSLTQTPPKCACGVFPSRLAAATVIVVPLIARAAFSTKSSMPQPSPAAIHQSRSASPVPNSRAKLVPNLVGAAVPVSAIVGDLSAATLPRVNKTRGMAPRSAAT